MSLATPQSGQVKSSGLSSHLVPGAMPFSGSPFSSSYSQPQTKQTYFMIFTSETEFLPNFILCRLREVMPRKRINYIISTFGILSIVFGKIFRKNFRNALSVWQTAKSGRIIKAMKVNYDKKMSEILSSVPKGTPLLLHSCCAPCSSACIEALKEYFRLTVFYYNPNIDEDKEYEKRKAEQIRFLQTTGWADFLDC